MSEKTPTWIADWNPEDPTFWETKGKAIARRNLIWSIVAEHLGEDRQELVARQHVIVVLHEDAAGGDVVRVSIDAFDAEEAELNALAGERRFADDVVPRAQASRHVALHEPAVQRRFFETFARGTGRPPGHWWPPPCTV